MLVICSFPSHTHLSSAQIINLKYLSLVFWVPLESDHFLKVHSFPKGTLYISQTHLLPSVLLILHTFAHVMSPVWTVVSPATSTLSLSFLYNTLAGPLLLRIWLVLAWVCHFCSVSWLWLEPWTAFASPTSCPAPFRKELVVWKGTLNTGALLKRKKRKRKQWWPSALLLLLLSSFLHPSVFSALGQTRAPWSQNYTQALSLSLGKVTS